MQINSHVPSSPPAGADRPLLPARERRLLIRFGHAITCDPGIGDVRSGELLIEDGWIRAVGRDLDATGATVVDAPHAVAIPGFVDSHWHLWTSLMRTLVVDGDPDRGYFPLKRLLGPRFTPADTYWSLRLGLAEGLLGGITTVHDWYHNVRSADDADAALQAHLDAGVRSHVSIGAAEGSSDAEPIDLDLVGRLAAKHPRVEGRVTLGIALRGPQRCPAEVVREEREAARELGVPVTMHAATSVGEVERIRAVEHMRADGLLDERTLVIHAVHTSAAEHAALAAAGAFVSLSPASEMRIGMGVPPVAALVAAGVDLCLSIDTLALTGTADPFGVMRLALDIARAQGLGEAALPARRVLEMATIDGARALELDRVTGSLTPGKRADVALVALDTLNVAPAIDLPTTLVHSARPENVVLVVADGRILKRDGRLLTPDSDAIVPRAARQLQALCERSGLQLGHAAAPTA